MYMKGKYMNKIDSIEVIDVSKDIEMLIEEETLYDDIDVVSICGVIVCGGQAPVIK